MKTNKVTTALILALVFLLADMWEIRAVKVKNVGEVVLPPKWEIMSCDKKTHTLYMKRRVDKDADWQAQPRCPETILKHKESPKITET
jgi:hypothetical protein